MTGLIVFTHLHPQHVQYFEEALEGLDVELLPVHRFGRSSTYRHIAKTYQRAAQSALTGLLRDKKRFRPDYGWVLGACYSAGYGFWSEAFKEDDWGGVDGIVTIDSWYASTLGTEAAEADLKDLLAFAEAARNGARLLAMTYSSIRPGSLGYAHTSEVAEEIVRRVGEPEEGLLIESAKQGHGQILSQTGPPFLRRAVELFGELGLG